MYSTAIGIALMQPLQTILAVHSRQDSGRPRFLDLQRRVVVALADGLSGGVPIRWSLTRTSCAYFFGFGFDVFLVSSTRELLICCVAMRITLVHDAGLGRYRWRKVSQEIHSETDVSG